MIFFSPAIAILFLYDSKMLAEERYYNSVENYIFLLLVYISYRSSISVRYNCRAFSLSGFHFILCLLWFFFFCRCLHALCSRKIYIRTRKRANIRCAIFVKQRKNVNICQFVVMFSTFCIFWRDDKSDSKDPDADFFRNIFSKYTVK